MVVYGSRISYFTGKFETYLRYKEIPYELRPLGVREYLWTVPRKLGAAQMPTVVTDDGRWMSDTTPMIAWLERLHPQPAVIPPDPVQRFFSLLVEDYADEWLWRPAMHFRWSHTADRLLAGTRLAEEIIRVPLPLAERRRWVTSRQRRLFVRGDGIDSRTRAHAEAAVARAYGCLQPIFTRRPFLLGDRPTLADVGLMGPFWRHFAHDPTPARLMQETAPAVFEWTARTWNARAGRLGDLALLDGIPPDWAPLLREIGATHLEALAVNAAAHTAGAARHDLPVRARPTATCRRAPTASGASSSSARASPSCTPRRARRSARCSKSTAAGSRCGASASSRSRARPGRRGAVLPGSAHGAGLEGSAQRGLRADTRRAALPQLGIPILTYRRLSTMRLHTPPLSPPDSL